MGERLTEKFYVFVVCSAFMLARDAVGIRELKQTWMVNEVEAFIQLQKPSEIDNSRHYYQIA